MATKNLGRVKGLSAYEVAKEQGFPGSEAEWLASLKGEKGDRGLKGDKGDKGDQGIQGVQGAKGDKGEQGIQGIQGEQGIQGIQGVKGFSPSASVEQISDNRAKVTITDESGTTEAELSSVPLYDTTGDSIDGTMTQKVITDELEIAKGEALGATQYFATGYTYRDVNGKMHYNEINRPEAKSMKELYTFPNTLSTISLLTYGSTATHIYSQWWDMSKVSDIADSFISRDLIYIDVSNWDVSKCKSFHQLFQFVQAEVIDVSNWVVDQVTNLVHFMFDCTNLKVLDLSKWDVSNVTEAFQAFYRCHNLTTFIGGRQGENEIALKGLSQSLDLSCSPLLDRYSLRAVINGLADLSGTGGKTLALGPTLRAKLQPEDIEIAMTKNWTIA